MTCFQGSYPEIGRCLCGAAIHDDSFRDRESYLEFCGHSGLCQQCQDDVFLAGSGLEEPRWFPLRRGVLASSVVRGGVLAELALLPFLFVVPRAELVWEPRYLTRVGPRLAPLDFWDELLPMRRVLEGHQVRLEELDSFEHPRAHERLGGADLVIGLDRPSIEAAAEACPFLPAGDACVALEDEVPWREAYGRALLPLHDFVCSRPRPLSLWWSGDTTSRSSLRVLAMLGLVLGVQGLRAHRDRRPFDFVLASRAHRFEESSWRDPDGDC